MTATQPDASPTGQRGAALIASLMFLLVMTVIGVTAMQVTSLEEKMTGNMRDRALAFQAAESALRAAEARLDPTGALPVFDNTSGFYKTTTATPSYWNTITDWSSTSDQVQHHTAETLAHVATAPAYVVEELTYTSSTTTSGGSLEAGVPIVSSGTQTWYRITARGTGGTDNAMVMLQSIYRR